MKKWYFAFFLMFSWGTLFSYVFRDAQQEEAYQVLDAMAREAKTDKSSLHHNYTRVYADYFSSIKDLPLTFVEIGVLRGESIALWERYFPNAELHFLDVDYSRLEITPNRSFLHVVDQSNREALLQFVEEVGGSFDIIIDDGGHTMKQQQISFTTLFPYLKSGGMYIIEDLHTSYWSSYGGKGALGQPQAGGESTTEFLKKLVDDVNYWGAFSGCADRTKQPEERMKPLTFYQKEILSLHFYDSLCFIIKR